MFRRCCHPLYLCTARCLRSVSRTRSIIRSYFIGLVDEGVVPRGVGTFLCASIHGTYVSQLHHRSPVSARVSPFSLDNAVSSSRTRRDSFQRTRL